jgi:hypothetical protein
LFSTSHSEHSSFSISFVLRHVGPDFVDKLTIRRT